jgi:hypothetical protein
VCEGSAIEDVRRSSGHSLVTVAVRGRRRVVLLLELVLVIAR